MTGDAIDQHPRYTAPAVPAFRHGVLRTPGSWIAEALGFRSWTSFRLEAVPGHPYTAVIGPDWAHMATSPSLLDLCLCDDIAMITAELDDGGVRIELVVSDRQPELPIFQA